MSQRAGEADKLNKAVVCSKRSSGCASGNFNVDIRIAVILEYGLCISRDVGCSNKVNSIEEAVCFANLTLQSRSYRKGSTSAASYSFPSGQSATDAL